MGGSKKNDEELLLKAIQHYQDGIGRYLERNDEIKMLHSLNKLSSYPIRVSHLQETGVGRTVNSLVKLDGKVGELAKSLIAKWKQMVENEKDTDSPKSNEEESPVSHSQDVEQLEEQNSRCERSQTSSDGSNSSEEEQQKSENRDTKKHRSSNHSSDNKRTKSSHNDKDRQNTKREKDKYSRHEKDNSPKPEKEHSSRTEKERSSKHEKERSSRHEKEYSSRHEKEHSSRHEKEHSSRHEKKHSSGDEKDHSSRHGKEHSSRQEKDHSSQQIKKEDRESSKRQDEKSRKDKDEKRHKEKDRSSHKEKSGSLEKESDSKSKKDRSSHKEKSGSLEKESDSKSKKDRSSHREKDDSREKDRSSRKEKGESDVKDKNDRSSHREKEGSLKEKIDKNNKEKDKKDKISKEKDNDKKGSSSSSSKKEKTSNSHQQKDEVNSESIKKNKKSSEIRDGKDKSSHSKLHISEISSESGTSFGEALGMMGLPRKEKKSDKKGKPSSSRKVPDEITSESGTSFADALGMVEVPMREKKSLKRTRNEVEDEDIEFNSNSGTSFEDALGMIEAPRKKKKSTQRPAPSGQSSVNNLLAVMPVPTEEEKTEILQSLLPSINPHYKPIRASDTRVLNDIETFDIMMKQKNHRTKIYSGNKATYMKVPSLFEICVQLLQAHIDAIEGTGGVPYHILKPVLEKATAEQLFRLEYYNSYLTEDSDELWKLHCQKSFRTKQREECETWRDMYTRCTEERDNRLVAITANIKHSRQMSTPVRKTKIAYIDPPSAGSRRQSKHSAAPMAKAKVVSMVKDMKDSADVVVNHQRKAGRSSGSTPGPSQVKVVKKMAPLMAKSISAFKNRLYKR